MLHPASCRVVRGEPRPTGFEIDRLSRRGAGEGALQWDARFEEDFFFNGVEDESQGLRTVEDGSRLTGTLTKLDGTFANVDVPIFAAFSGPNAEILWGTNDLVSFDSEGELRGEGQDVLVYATPVPTGN